MRLLQKSVLLTFGPVSFQGFYVAKKSEWLSGLPAMQDAGYHHYVVVGRDGYVELIAERYRWREWPRTTGHREDLAALGAVVESGEGA
jgi:hypothetical protein